MPRNTQLRVLPHPSTGLDLALDVFITAKQAERCTPRTIGSYRWTLNRFLSWLQGQGVMDAQGITPHHVRLYLADLDSHNYAASYVHTYARTIKTWLRFLHAEGLIPVDPMAKVIMPRLDKQILPAFAPEDVKRLLAACHSERDKAIVLCLLDTGCRAAEFVNLNIGDFDRKTGAVRVRLGKGRKDRSTFVGAKATKALLRYLAYRQEARSGDPLFPSATTGERLTTNGLLLLCRRLGKRAGVDHCSPHCFRRSFALWSLRSGMDIFSLQRLMGHSDLTVLRRYLALVEEDLADAHRKHGAVDNML